MTVAVATPLGADILVGKGNPLLLIAGPCALESEELARVIAGEMQ